jgi:putative Mg2+ transporter-C (MgtC) family protein
MEIDVLSISKLLMAIALGGAIGLEREYRNKVAGYRTMILICLGATIYTISSIKMGGSLSTDRIAANIVTGIGFIGAGVIFKNQEDISGLNTAATIWLTAAVGIMIGNGEFQLSVVSTVLTLLVLRMNYYKLF